MNIQAKVQVAPKVVHKTKNGISVYAWGENNLWPKEALDLVNNSGTAKKCIEKTSQYLLGMGLSCKDASPLVQQILDKINKEVLPEVCANFAFLPILATNPIINAAGRIKDLKAIDTTALRSGMVDESLKADKWWTSGDWSNAREQFDPKYPERLALDFMVYQGVAGEVERFKEYSGNLKDWQKLRFIIIDVMKGLGDTIYPTPTWWAGANAIYLDGESLIYQVDNLDNRFNADTVVHIKENLDGITEDGRDKREAIKEKVRNKFTGRSNPNNNDVRDRFILIDGIDAPMEFHAVPNNATWQMYDAIFKTANATITEVFGVPVALLNGIQSASIGQTKQLIDSITLFNTDTRPARKQIASYFEGIVNNWEGVTQPVKLEIPELSPISELPDAVISRMSNEQLFATFGIKIEENA